MRIPITLPDETYEDGLMFDIQRARDEGLFEEVTLTSVLPGGGLVEIPLTEDQARALLDIHFDVSANLEPGTEVTLTTELRYRYDYGRVETPTPA